jgi:acetyltransferase-like isoleucine patch superfamily enzyme
VVIAGAGNLGKLLYDCLDGDERWRLVGFIDDGHAGEQCYGLPVFGSADYDPALARSAFLAIGFPEMRRAMAARLAPIGLTWQRFVDRRAMVGRHATLGEGVLVLSFAMVASSVRIGAFSYLSSYAHVGTGASVGEYSSILPAASIGKSAIGDDCVIGLRSACLDGASVGDGTVVAPFTLLRKPVPAGAFVAGSPPRIVRRATDQPVSATTA